MADLNSLGKMDSEMERLMRVVIRRRRESRHDLRRRVGIRSREQVASEEDSMADRTSSIVAGENVEREGGGEGEGSITFVSSANFKILLIIPSSRSFINRRNRKGPSTEPCGTPL